MADVALPDPGPLVHLYELQLRIVRSAERLQSMPAGPASSGSDRLAGDDAIGAAVAAHRRDGDVVLTPGRGPADLVARGVGVPELFEVCLGGTADEGTGVELASGFGLAAQLDESERVVVVVFDDHLNDPVAQAVDLAAAWRLPVVFVSREAGVDPARAVGPDRSLPVVASEGGDPVAIWSAVGESVARARRGGGPTLVVVGRVDDTIERLRDALVAAGRASAGELAALEARVAADVDDGFRLAMESRSSAVPA